MSGATKPSIQEIAIAGVYAQAMLNLADGRGETDSVLEELESLSAELDKNPAFDAFMHSPLIEAETRGQALDRMFRGKMNEILLDALQVMNHKGRSTLVRAFVEAYRREYEEHRGQVRAKVRTAVRLSEDLRRQLAQAVSDYTGKTAKLEERVEASLIGGMVLLIGDRKIDTSVVKEIRGLEQRLLDRASHEIHSGRTYLEEAS